MDASPGRTGRDWPAPRLSLLPPSQEDQEPPKHPPLPLLIPRRPISPLHLAGYAAVLPIVPRPLRRRVRVRGSLLKSWLGKQLFVGTSVSLHNEGSHPN